MLKKYSLPILCFVLFIGSAKAYYPFASPKEGMWLLTQLQGANIAEMQKMGCELSAEDIFSIQKSSLKDAVVEFGGFCTGEFVSDKGLVFTNHHCGYDAIAGQSTVEHDYLDNGFWSKSYNEELPIAGLYVDLLMNIQDVTDSILPYVKDMDPMARSQKVAEISARLAAAEKAKTGYRGEVKSLYYGNQYYLFSYQRYTDVRLVAAPPQSIGKFGGDTDNWMWPRHTGDFSIFRVYADKNNDPADYSADNIPYQPKKFLQISIKGFEENDFTMIMGYPGQTTRYMTSYEMTNVIKSANPAEIDVLKTLTDVMKADMDKNDSVRLKISSDYAELMNSLKLFEGQVEWMSKIDAPAVKKQNEDDFMKWEGKQNQDMRTRYDSLMVNFKSAYTMLDNMQTEFYLKIFPMILMPSSNLATEINQALEPLLQADSSKAAIDAAVADVKSASEESFKKMNYQTEYEKAAAILNLLYTQLPADKQPAEIQSILSKSKGATPQDKFLNWSKAAFSKSVFTTPEKLNAFLKNPTEKALQKDALYNFYVNLYNNAMTLRPQYVQAKQLINKYTRDYIAGIMMEHPDKMYYPDANFTMRLSYGKIQDFDPRDGVHYKWQTTLDGVIEKMDNTSDEFTVPDKLLQLYKDKDYGQYADKKTGKLPVCFLTDNDITGGNSGSPVMNGKGQLIGLAFDGNIEGTPGDYIFDENENRTIAVDIRYVLFLIDKYGDDQRLIKELTIDK